MKTVLSTLALFLTLASPALAAPLETLQCSLNEFVFGAQGGHFRKEATFSIDEGIDTFSHAPQTWEIVGTFYRASVQTHGKEMGNLTISMLVPGQADPGSADIWTAGPWEMNLRASGTIRDNINADQVLITCSKPDAAARLRAAQGN